MASTSLFLFWFVSSLIVIAEGESGEQKKNAESMINQLSSLDDKHLFHQDAKESTDGIDIKPFLKESILFYGTPHQDAKPSDQESTKPAKESFLFYGTPHQNTKPSDHESKESFVFYGTPHQDAKPSDHESTKPAKESLLLYGHQDAKPSYQELIKPSKESFLFYGSHQNLKSSQESTDNIKPSKESFFLYGTPHQNAKPSDRESTKAVKESFFLYGTPHQNAKPSDRESTKAAKESFLLYGTPHQNAKPSDHESKESFVFYGTPHQDAKSSEESTGDIKPSKESFLFYGHQDHEKPSDNDIKPKALQILDEDEEGSNLLFASLLFFRLNSLSAMRNVQLPISSDSIPSNKFLHPDLEKVFARMDLPMILKVTSTSSESYMGHASKNTWNVCKAPNLPGEIKKCVTSMEGMVDFVTSILSPEANSTTAPNQIKFLATSQELVSSAPTKPLRVLDRRVVSKTTLVSCHPLTFPYAVYMCHAVPKSLALKVTLQGVGGEPLIAPAVCHLDTSTFNPSHISFKVLHTTPGAGEICHWLPTSSHRIWYV